MGRRRQILYASMNHAWDYGWAYYQMLAEALSRESDVVYVDAPVSVARFRLRRARLLLRSEAEPVSPSLCVLRSATFPAHRNDWLRWQAGKLAARRTKRWAERAGFEPDLVWCWMAYDLELLKRFPGAFSTFLVADHERVLYRESEIMERVDAILCGSFPVLERIRAQYGEKAHFFPGACDFERYRAAADEPAELPMIERPIFGYAGFVGERLDYRLLEELARGIGTGTVVVAGPIRGRDPEELQRLSDAGVVFLGPLERGEVPRVIAAFDVALIPYLDNEFNRNSNPVKLYEYLALAKPSVSTDIPTLRAIGGEVASIGPRDTFVERALEALDSAPGTPEERIALARTTSFEAAAERLDEIVAERDVRVAGSLHATTR
jgi:glycosyltransferase involved in cell wall biosynthesis